MRRFFLTLDTIEVSYLAYFKFCANKTISKAYEHSFTGSKYYLFALELTKHNISMAAEIKKTQRIPAKNMQCHSPAHEQ